MSRPASACFFTMSAIPRAITSRYLTRSLGRPVVMLPSSSISWGRGRLPTWVVRIRSSLRFMGVLRRAICPACLDLRKGRQGLVAGSGAPAVERGGDHVAPVLPVHIGQDARQALHRP